MWIKAYTKNFVIMAAVVLLSVGCGGGSDGGAGEDPGFSNNLSGVWNGTITPAGAPPLAMNVTINQPVSGSLVSTRSASVSLSGTVVVPGGSFPMTGTKDGNNVTMQFTNGTQTATLTGALASENAMSGNFTITPTGDSGTWQLTR